MRHRPLNYGIQTLTVLFAVLIRITQAQSQTGDAEHDKVQTACQEAAAAAALSERYEQLAKTTADNARTLMITSAMWRQKAAETTDIAKSATLTAISEVAKNLAMQALTKQSERENKMTAARKRLAQRAAFLDGVHYAIRPTFGAQTHPFKATTTTLEVRSGNAKTLTDTCTTQNRQEQSQDIQGSAAGATAWKKLKYSTKNEIVKLVPTQKVTLTFGLAGYTAQSVSNGYGTTVTNCNGAINSASEPTLDTIGTATPTLQSIYEQDTPSKGCAHKTINDNDNDAEMKKLLKAICEAQQATAITVPSTADLTLENLSNNPAVILAVRNGAPQFHNLHDSSENQATDKIKNYIKEALGTTPEKFTELFVEKIKDEDVSYRGPKETTKVKRQALAKQQEAGASITYFQDKRTVKPQAEKAKESSTAKKRKEDTDENICTEDKDCAYKDGKCKLKEGVEAEGTGGKDGKTTNTTGSNSFVIKKSPLLLANFTSRITLLRIIDKEFLPIL
uniref:Variant surface glycoprotein 1125.4160 n=1 Tax=Trypanosoma brucei TaxID=5691 RepID=A0A1J0RA25_9TRYP|nr:variant surface glycoprotein 1125.4160 [Trypanosoma brucei]